MMARDCIINLDNHAYVRTDIPMCQQGYKKQSVIIGNDVGIGSRVIILPGVHIGNHCITWAGSIVTKGVPDWAIAVGNPAVVKKYRNNTEILR